MTALFRFSIFLSVSIWAIVGCNSQPAIQPVQSTLSNDRQDTAIIQVFPIEELLGKIEPSRHPDFSTVPITAASKEGLWLRSEAVESFLKMKNAAKADGVALTIISATRTFKHQKRIWEAKWNGTRKVEGQSLNIMLPNADERARKILEYSSMPGTSRHHWGTDIDINSLDPDYFESGRGKTEYEWLQLFAKDFGFCQTYSAKSEDRPAGYEMEKWHWSFMPIASPMLAAYAHDVDSSAFGGFDGDSALPFSEIMQYVSGIASECE